MSGYKVTVDPNLIHFYKEFAKRSLFLNLGRLLLIGALMEKC